MSRHHVNVTVAGRTDGLVILRHHFRSPAGAIDYAEEVEAKPPYLASVERCSDEACSNFDITADAR